MDPVERINQEGFCVLPKVVPARRLGKLLEASERAWSAREPGQEFVHDSGFLESDDGTFLSLVDLPEVLQAVDRAFGQKVWIFHSHLTISGRNCESPTSFVYRWHQDAKGIIADLAATGSSPRVSIKAGFFLTGVTSVDSGAMWVQPGSHLSGRCGIAEPVPVLGEPGSCVLFDNRLWHSRGPNCTTSPRHAVFFAYGYRWLRHRDCLIPKYQCRLTQSQRRLLIPAVNGREAFMGE